MAKPHDKITPQQRRFVDKYLELGSIEKAALEAGYSESYARSRAHELLLKPKIKEYYDKILAELEDAAIASAAEVMKHLTSVLRGESKSNIVVVEGCGEGVSCAREVEKAPDERERLKAAELLGKRYGLFTDKTQLEGDINLEIKVDYGGESNADSGTS